jgi:hypothetical protein
VVGFRQARRTTLNTGGSVRCGDITIFLLDGALLFSTPQVEKPNEISLQPILNGSGVGLTQKELSTDRLTFDLPEVQPIFRLIFDRVTFRRDAGDVRIISADFYLLEK